MARYDRMSTLSFLVLAVAICIESIRLGPGSLSNPGPGLVPLGSGLILGIFSFIVLIRSGGSLLEKEETIGKTVPERKKMISILVSLVGYAFLITPLGFHLVNFLWMTFLCRGLGKMEWKASFFFSLIATFSCYLLFEYYLQIRFPRGIWGVWLA